MIWFYKVNGSSPNITHILIYVTHYVYPYLIGEFLKFIIKSRYDALI